MKSKIVSLVFLGMFVFSAFFSVAQMTVTVKANEPACAGLACNQPSDCGTKCFCNGPSSACYLD